MTKLDDALADIDWGDLDTYKPYVPEWAPVPEHYLKYVKGMVSAAAQQVMHKLNPEGKKALKAQVKDDMLSFLIKCRVQDINPLNREMYPIYRKNQESQECRMAIEAGIDSIRKMAGSNKYYMGQSEYKIGWADETRHRDPLTATVEVYRANPVTGEIQATTHTAYASEFAKTLTGQVGKFMPSHMLGIRAEGHALRRAFPKEVGQVYTEGELQETQRVEADEGDKKDLIKKVRAKQNDS